MYVSKYASPETALTDRWSTWARSLSKRHERIAARHGALFMTLAVPLGMFTSINHRWERFALALFPRIRVSIGPILLEIAHGQFPSVPRVGQALTLPVTALRNRTIFENKVAGARSNGQRLEPRFVSHSTVVNAPGSLQVGQLQLAATTGRTLSPDVADSTFVSAEIQHRNTYKRSPLRRVFARIDGGDPAVVFSRIPFEKESRAIAHRMVQERLRLEQRKQGDMVVRTQTMAAASTKNRSLETEAEFASTPKARDRTWPDKSPEINVEQLTEQVIRKIDHRITAYRERLGRAF